MSNGVRYTPTFAMPTEYERAAMEARRRQRMAEMLAQQAYTPQDIGSAPIPRAAPLVQGLQAFLTARQQRKAEEALEKAQTADVEGYRKLREELGPRSQIAAPTNTQIAESVGMPQIAEDGTVSYGQTTMPKLGMEQVMPTAQERERLIEDAFLTGTPRAQKYAQYLIERMKEKPEEEEFGTTPVKGADGRYYLVSKAGRTIPTDIGIPEEEITPYQLAQLGMDQERLGLEQQRIELQRAGGPEPLHIVDVNGVPTYIPRSQAAGRPAFVSKTAAGPTGDDRADRRKHRDTRIQLQNAYDSIAEFAKELKNTPKEASLYGAAAGRLSSKYKLALGAVRVLQNTGVLNPGELPFIEDTLRDPQSLKQLFNPASRETITGQINAIADLLERQSRTNDELYEYDVTPLKNRDWRSETIPARALAAGLTQADWDRATEEEKAAWR